MRPVRHDLSQSLAAKQTVATSASGPVPGARGRQLLSTSTRPTGSGKTIEEASPRSRPGGDVRFLIRWTGSSRSPGRLQSTQRVAAVKPSLRCPAVPHHDHLPPGRPFGGISPPPGRSRTSRVCRSGSAPGNALSASGRLSLYVVSRYSPVSSSVMYQLKNSVGFGIACGGRTTLPRIEARACIDQTLSHWCRDLAVLHRAATAPRSQPVSTTSPLSSAWHASESTSCSAGPGERCRTLLVRRLQRGRRSGPGQGRAQVGAD